MNYRNVKIESRKVVLTNFIFNRSFWANKQSTYPCMCASTNESGNKSFMDESSKTRLSP